jgi:hypothetical protein
MAKPPAAALSPKDPSEEIDDQVKKLEARPQPFYP